MTQSSPPPQSFGKTYVVQHQPQIANPPRHSHPGNEHQTDDQMPPPRCDTEEANGSDDWRETHGDASLARQCSYYRFDGSSSTDGNVGDSGISQAVPNKMRSAETRTQRRRRRHKELRNLCLVICSDCPDPIRKISNGTMLSMNKAACAMNPVAGAEELIARGVLLGTYVAKVPQAAGNTGCNAYSFSEPDMPTEQ